MGEPQGDGEPDEPLLRAVVEVALEPAPLGIGRLHDAKSRRLELVARVRARESKRNQLRERLQATLCVRRLRLVRSERDDQSAPRRRQA